MDEVEFDNKKYISSKRASKITGYSNDYIGQLVRSGDIEGRKIGKTWFIEAKSLLKYQYDKQVVKSGNKNTTTSSSLFARLPSIQQNKTLTLVVSMFAVVILITSSVYLAGGKEVITKQISALKESTVNDIGGVKEVAQVWVDNIDIYKTSVARAVEKTNTSLGTLKIKTTQKISKLKNHIADVFNDMESNTVNIIADATGKSKIFASMAYVKTKTIVLNTYNSTKKTINGSLEQTSEFLASANTEATKSTFSNFTTSVKDKIKLWIGIFNTKDKIPDKKPAQEDLKLADIKLQQQPETKNTPQAPIQKITINKPIEKVTVEKTIERIISGVTKEDLESRIQQLNNKLASEIARVADAASRTGRSNFKTIALTNKIDNLSNITVNGVTGLTDSDIPDTITVSNYLRLSGGTLTGAFAGTSGTFSTNFGVGTTSPSDTLAVDGQVYLAQVSAPAVTANRLYNSSGTLYWNGTALGGGGGGGSGSFTQSAGFIYNSTTTDQILLGATATTSTQKLEVIGGGYFFGNVGIGTTSPYAKLSVVGETVAEYFTATSTSATTTLAGGLDVGGGVFNYDSSSSKIILNAPNAIDGAMEITISASGFAQSTSGLKITGTNLGTISKAKGIVLDIDDTGANSYGLYMTGSARHGFYYSSTQTGFFRGINIINDSISSGLSDAKWFSAESSSTSLGDEAVLYRGVLSGATTAGRFLSFENSDNAADVFVVNNDGNVGIATSSPYAKLSVVGETVAEYFTATSTSATSTFWGKLSAVGNIGIGGVYVDANRGINYSSVDPSAITYGTYRILNIGTSNDIYGTYNSIINDGDSTTKAYGLYNSISNTGTGGYQTSYGVYNSLTGGTTGEVLIGLYNNITIGTGANSGEKAYGVYTVDGNSGGSSSNIVYGSYIDIDDPTTTNYSIYVESGSGISYFGSNVGIGTTSPYAKLSVVGETVAEYFTATSTTATTTLAGGLNVDSGTLSVDYSAGTVGVGVTPASVGKLKVGGAGYFTSENNAFGSGSAYTSLVLGDASSASGALFAFDDGTASSPYVGLSGYSTGSERGLYFGGGGWDVADANAIYFYVDPTYSSSGDTNGGILAMKIFPDGGVVIGSGVPTAANDGVLNVYRNFNDIDVTFQNAIEAKYAIGYDHSEDSFKISKGDTLGVNDRFTIVSSGNIGIGTSSPYAKLSVAGNAAFSGLSNDGTGYYLCLNTTTYEMSTSTTACGASSERFKQNIQDISYGLDDVLKLRPVSFDWKKDFIQNGSKQIGFIAEEVESIIPEIVGYDNEGKVMNLDYPKLTSVLAKAIQEQQGQIEKLSEYIKGDTVELDGSGESAFWSIDNTSGRIKYITPLDLNGFDIINVSAIVGTMSRWSIDASGRLVVDEVSANKVTTNILCVDDICIDKEKFKEIFADNVTVTTQTADTANSMDVEGNNNSDGISSDAEDTATTTDTETVQSDEDNTTNNNTSTTTDPTAGTVQDIQTSTTTSMTDTTLDPVLGCTDSDANNYNKDATKDDNSCTYPDTTPPIITLNGESTIELTVGDVYSEDGATAEDDIDGDITDNIIVSGDMVDTATAGIYTITYDVSDDAGNSALKVKRVVTVIEPVQVGTDINTVQ